MSLWMSTRSFENIYYQVNAAQLFFRGWTGAERNRAGDIFLTYFRSAPTLFNKCLSVIHSVPLRSDPDKDVEKLDYGHCFPWHFYNGFNLLRVFWAMYKLFNSSLLLNKQHVPYRLFVMNINFNKQISQTVFSLRSVPAKISVFRSVPLSWIVI